jgi:hypothetical protein
LNYHYYEVTLGRDANGQKALQGHLRQALGDHLVAVFSPSLGYATDQALVLTDDAATAGAVTGAPGVASARPEVLSPTTRPAAGARPKPGGIYVHRWLTIDAGAVDEFVALSNEAWVGFEGGFDSEVFGLFAAEPSAQDHKAGERRMLLMTHYRDFATWEASRKPDPKTAKAFARRRELTRVALPRACILMAEA